MPSLSALDLLGPSHSVTFQGQDTLQTKLGTLLTFILVFSIVSSSFTFFRDYLDTSNMTVTNKEGNLEKKYVFNIAENGILPIFFVHSYNDQGYIQAENVFNRFSFFLSTTEIGADDKGRLTFDNTLNMGVPCKELEDNPSLYNYVAKASNYEEIKEKVHKFGVCIRMEEVERIFVRGNGNEKDDRRIFIRVGPCVGRTDCISENNFNFELNTVLPDIISNLYNKDQPFEIKFNLDNYIRTWSWLTYNMYTVKATLRTINDAPRIYGEEVEVARFANVIEKQESTYLRYSSNGRLLFSDCVSDTQIFLDSCQGFLRLDYKFFPLVTNYSRSLPRITDLLSEIGGISGLLFTVFGYINAFYLYFMKDRIMTNRLFPLLRYLSKNTDKKKSKEIRAEAAKLVESTFDFHTLFQEICCLKMLTKLLLTEDQQNSASLLPLYEQLKFKSEEKKSKPIKYEKTLNSLIKKHKIPKSILPSLVHISSFIQKLKTHDLNLIKDSPSKESSSINKPSRNIFESIKQQIDSMILESMNGLAIVVPQEVVEIQRQSDLFSESNRCRLPSQHDSLIAKEQCKLQSVEVEFDIFLQQVKNDYSAKD